MEMSHDQPQKKKHMYTHTESLQWWKIDCIDSIGTIYQQLWINFVGGNQLNKRVLTPHIAKRVILWPILRVLNDGMDKMVKTKHEEKKHN